MNKNAKWPVAMVSMACVLGAFFYAEAKVNIDREAELATISHNASLSMTSEGNERTVSLNDAQKLDEYINNLYKSIDFSKARKLDKKVFTKALHGYLNLKQSGQLDPNRSVISICDFSLSSNEPRLWVIDLKTKKVLFNTLVAHGQGSGEEYATSFSNVEGSHQSSMGFFVTANTYYGDKGYSLKLIGKDAGYNCQAYNRAIVIHAADYVSPDFIKANKRLGRSWGCPALPVALNRPIIDAIKGGTALFIYSDNAKYLASSKWLKKYPQIDASEKMNPAKTNTMLAEVPQLNGTDTAQ